MHNRKLFWALALVGVLALSAFAADVSGKWKAEFETPNGQTRTSNLTLKADGETLTGTISGRGGDTAISEGKVSGDEISFVVVRDFQGQQMKSQYKGKVAGDEIKMSVQFREDMPAREMVYKRVKE
ncbi:MAG: hypothetical protein ABSH05_14005 [Bryobacteraceae bacterium]|jgi:hypothetical protein